MGRSGIEWQYAESYHSLKSNM